MKQVNVPKELGKLAKNPELARARGEKWKANGVAAREVKKKYRLFYGEDPATTVVEAFPMEVNAWNKNARAFYQWQNSLGRDCLPILLWKEEEDGTKVKVYRVIYLENGQKKCREIVGQSKAHARREFNRTASVTARVDRIEEDEE